jgi:hypothetical protein
MYILYSTVVWLCRPYVDEVTQTLKSPLRKGPPHEFFLKKKQKIKFRFVSSKTLNNFKDYSKNKVFALCNHRSPPKTFKNQPCPLVRPGFCKFLQNF